MVLRNRIVEYEGRLNISGIEERFKKITQLLTEGTEDEWEQYVYGILNIVKVLTFPKSIENNNNNTLFTNKSSSNVKIEQERYFIDINVEGSILSILWIFAIGINLDNCFYRHSYGNRLKKTLVDQETGMTSFSPYLFKPYYKQYESWRDYGLKYSQELLKKKQDVLIFTLDLKDYFHSVHFNEEVFKDLIKKDKYHDSCHFKRLNDFVFKVLYKYSSDHIFDQKENVFLPIGFYPSNILSNYYLDAFDKAVISKWYNASRCQDIFSKNLSYSLQPLSCMCY